MKKGSIVLNIILFSAVAVLFFLYVDSNKQMTAQMDALRAELTSESDPIDSSTMAKLSPFDGAVVFFNRDSLFQNCTKVQKLVKQLEEKERTLSAQYEKKAKAFQDDYIKAQQKTQTEFLTEKELAELQQEFAMKEQALMQEQQLLQQDLLRFQNELNEKLYQMVYGFIQKINKDQKFDYVLTYSKDMPLLYPFNDSLDITSIIIDGLDKQ